MKHMKLPTLYKRNTTGSIQQWAIFSENGKFWTESGQVGGTITKSKPTVCQVKNDGKANETTATEQAEKEALAKWEKKKRQKHFENVEDIDKETFISPILASPRKDRKKPFVFPALIQIKYNGVCCITDKEFGSRSRKGEVFHNIKHINSKLKKVFEEYPDLVLHGELFNYDLRRDLNRLVELVAVTRKDKDLTQDLIQESEKVVNFYVYDGYFKGQESYPYQSRFRRINFILNKFFNNGPVYVAPTHEVHDINDVTDFARQAVEDGQEGAILRMKDMPYIHKRSRELIKIKHSEDEEYKVIRFEEGKGNWQGMAKAVWCELPEGKREKKFKVNIRGTQKFLKSVWEKPEKYIGKYITAEYPGKSEYGVPQHSYTDLVIRNYE